MWLLENALAYDHITFRWCQQRRCRRLLISLSRQISRSADGYLYALLAFLLWCFDHTSFVITALFAFATERSLYFVLKKRIRRNRPPDAIPGFKSIIEAADKFSFPSGHTSGAFLTATLLCLEFNSPLLALPLYSWACTVAWSRVMLGVHFPTDTLAGAVLGSSTALLFTSVFSVTTLIQ